jgi:hypothetical protein
MAGQFGMAGMAGINNDLSFLVKNLQTIVEFYGRIVALWPTRAKVEDENGWISGEGCPFPLTITTSS